MGGQDYSAQKPIGTREWYNFVGLLADILPHIHQGGSEATDILLEMCNLDASSQHLNYGKK